MRRMAATGWVRSRTYLAHIHLFREFVPTDTRIAHFDQSEQLAKRWRLCKVVKVMLQQDALTWQCLWPRHALLDDRLHGTLKRVDRPRCNRCRCSRWRVFRTHGTKLVRESSSRGFYRWGRHGE